jgi:hypothetical protein
MAEYPDKDFPWTFYFNGVIMPKWGACWPDFTAGDHRNWDWEIGPRDFYIIRCKIDHVGKIESANAHAFLYAVQELLCLLFTEKAFVSKHCRALAQQSGTPEETETIYESLVEAAFQMRECTLKDGIAMWTSGYEADRLSLVDAMRRAALPAKNPEHRPPPHIADRQRGLESLWKTQIKTLHQAGSSAGVPRAWRKKLLEL